MIKVVKAKALPLFLGFFVACAGACVENTTGLPQAISKDKVELVLSALQKKVAALGSYQADIEYNFRQPVLESETVRRGVMYYKKEAGRSKLRINFKTLKVDDEKQQKYAEQYIFDGVWLIKIDYQTAHADFYQKAPEDKPIDAFELAGEHFPIVGFARVGQLKEQFDIAFIQPQSGETNKAEHLYLKVKPDSTYAAHYTGIDLWIDKASSLPTRIVAKSTEGDIYDIRFAKAKINKKLPKSIFKVAIGPNFSTKREPLRRRQSSRGKG